MGAQPTPGTPPAPTDRAGLRREVLARQRDYGRVRRTGGGRVATSTAWLAFTMARLNTLAPVRALNHYNRRLGSLLASGIGVAMFFSISGLLTTGFSIAALALKSNPLLLDAVIANVATAVPGLLRIDGSEGLVDPASLLNPVGLGWTAAISLAVAVVTSLGWIGSVREGLRAMLMLGPLMLNPILAKLIDLGTLVLLGIALLLSSAATVVFGTALATVTDALGLEGYLVNPLGFAIGFVLATGLNWATVAILFRLAARIKLARKRFWQSSVMAAVAATILQLLSGFLLARAGANPLLAPFAVVIGLLIWFNFVSQVYLASAAWAAVGEADDAARRRGAVRPGRARSLPR
ncbi:YihY/virulence factor BrkB family protein [Arthrobacter sp. 35W]|uniref:YihY/virulence factor BrkB family protein n=1 Tax=Arthrobacter sp. 35W TaxID=1132441 RepID=UPI001E65DEF4|nr:YihY/virulence factor BrkB family protein [Arthrobacter sp. 35W]